MKTSLITALLFLGLTITSCNGNSKEHDSTSTVTNIDSTSTKSDTTRVANDTITTPPDGVNKNNPDITK